MAPGQVQSRPINLRDPLGPLQLRAGASGVLHQRGPQPFRTTDLLNAFRLLPADPSKQPTIGLVDPDGTLRYVAPEAQHVPALYRTVYAMWRDVYDGGLGRPRFWAGPEVNYTLPSISATRGNGRRGWYFDYDIDQRVPQLTKFASWDTARHLEMHVEDWDHPIRITTTLGHSSTTLVADRTVTPATMHIAEYEVFLNRSNLYSARQYAGINNDDGEVVFRALVQTLMAYMGLDTWEERREADDRMVKVFGSVYGDPLPERLAKETKLTIRATASTGVSGELEATYRKYFGGMWLRVHSANGFAGMQVAPFQGLMRYLMGTYAEAYQRRRAEEAQWASHTVHSCADYDPSTGLTW